MRVIALVVVVAACGNSQSVLAPPLAPPPVAPAVPKGDPEKSRALFGELAKVLLHPRCVNCHTPDGSPRQGDTNALHDPPVVRDVVGMLCTTCHQDRNLELARVPGAPNWRLAPVAMVWLDKTPAQICAQLKDPARNGHRTLAQVQDHLAHDALVAWGWAPGADRAPVPGTQAAVAMLAQQWIDTGAECP